MSGSVHPTRALALGVALAVAFGVVACASTAPRGMEPRGFLGDYTRLEPAPETPSEIFVDSRADFGRYDEILVEPVTIWVSRAAAVDASQRGDLERAADLLESALRRELGQEFEIVERAGPRTLRLRAAVSEAKAAEARVGVSKLAASASAPSEADTPLGAATRAFLADAAIEAEALDALSNRRLAAAVDPRAVELTLERSPTTWGDVEKAWQAWADGTQAALAAFRRNARAETQTP